MNMTRAFAVVVAGLRGLAARLRDGRRAVVARRRRSRPRPPSTSTTRRRRRRPPKRRPRFRCSSRSSPTAKGQRSNLVGYLAMPQDAAEPLPGIIVIHEWWGLNDNIKAMTRRLAGEGYVALAVDLYGGATAETPEAAQALMSGAAGRARRGAQQPAPGLRLPREVRVRAAHREHRLVSRRRLVAADRAAVSGRARCDGHVLRPGASRIAIASRR